MRTLKYQLNDRQQIRSTFKVLCILVFSWYSLSCDRRKSEYETRHTIPIKLTDINVQIRHLFDSGILKPIGAYIKDDSVIVRFIEVDQLGGNEIIVRSSNNNLKNVIFRKMQDDFITESCMEMSFVDNNQLGLCLEKLRRIKPDIALRASPQAVDASNYLIETYYNGECMAYYRDGFSPNFPGDLDDFRSLMFRIIRPLRRSR